jgi:hypothetical protein
MVANYASIPGNITAPFASLANHTNLFNHLGLLAIGGTLLVCVQTFVDTRTFER